MQSFVDLGIWDEIRIITNEELEIAEGIRSPAFRDAQFIKSENFGSDTIRHYTNLKI